MAGNVQVNFGGGAHPAIQPGPGHPPPGNGLAVQPAPPQLAAPGAGVGAAPQVRPLQQMQAMPVPTAAAQLPSMRPAQESSERRWFKAIALVAAAGVGAAIAGPIGAVITVAIAAKLLDQSGKAAAAPNAAPPLAGPPFPGGLHAQGYAPIAQPPHAPWYPPGWQAPYPPPYPYLPAYAAAPPPPLAGAGQDLAPRQQGAGQADQAGAGGRPVEMPAQDADRNVGDEMN